MNLNYAQSTGKLTQDDGTLVAVGWAGRGEGKNNPSMQDIKSTGPLPQGVYTVGEWHDHPRLGMMVAQLTQISGNTFGRSEFFIHGASRNLDKFGQESKGCIVLTHNDREEVKDLNPTTITVTEA